MKTAKTKSFFALALTVAVGAAVSAPQGGGGASLTTPFSCFRETWT